MVGMQLVDHGIDQLLGEHYTRVLDSGIGRIRAVLLFGGLELVVRDPPILAAGLNCASSSPGAALHQRTQQCCVQSLRENKDLIFLRRVGPTRSQPGQLWAGDAVGGAPQRGSVS